MTEDETYNQQILEKCGLSDPDPERMHRQLPWWRRRLGHKIVAATATGLAAFGVVVASQHDSGGVEHNPGTQPGVAGETLTPQERLEMVDNSGRQIAETVITILDAEGSGAQQIQGFEVSNEDQDRLTKTPEAKISRGRDPGTGEFNRVGATAVMGYNPRTGQPEMAPQNDTQFSLFHVDFRAKPGNSITSVFSKALEIGDFKKALAEAVSGDESKAMQVEAIQGTYYNPQNPKEFGGGALRYWLMVDSEQTTTTQISIGSSTEANTGKKAVNDPAQINQVMAAVAATAEQFGAGK